MRPSSLAPTRADLSPLAFGALLTVAAAAAAIRMGAPVSVGTLAAIALFAGLVASFLSVPHVTVAAMIPTFALLPAVKVLAVPWIGPLKDLVTLAAITAAGVLAVQRASAGQRQRGDVWVTALVAFLVGLYLLNLGGRLERDVAWAQGARLMAEPLLLLLVGLTLPDARRTLRWGIASLVPTGVFVALTGIAQQVVGESRLIDLGYSYTLQVRSIDGRLRSFGTMDEAFAYAAFLLLAFAAVLLWRRRGIVAGAAGGLIVVGIACAQVRTSAVIALALLGLWLARNGRPAVAMFVIAAAVTAASALLVWSSGGTDSRTVRAGPSVFLTINGRTEGWKVVLDEPRTWVIGKGVGEVGVAAERATYSVSRSERKEEQASAVDSGYFALIADIGIVGLVVFLALAMRLLVLAKRAIDRGLREGWIATGFLTVILLDAVTRDSFTGFPTAFLGMLLVGLSLAAAHDAAEAEKLAARQGRTVSIAAR